MAFTSKKVTYRCPPETKYGEDQNMKNIYKHRARSTKNGEDRSDENNGEDRAFIGEQLFASCSKTASLNFFTSECTPQLHIRAFTCIYGAYTGHIYGAYTQRTRYKFYGALSIYFFKIGRNWSLTVSKHGGL